ncbi:hypothetical protein GIB67_039861 [Kingdonia uniflora]|uniref:Uncharacterized protein n=1 Tax=Kingdonia uniflora TaxID=39325 RepID=A0A7J7P3J6_9MAGN|nr:hypothetical protein GIB67_039861 [Kingdonia uniflora]
MNVCEFEVSRFMSTDTSTTAQTPSECFLQNRRKLTSRMGTKVLMEKNDYRIKEITS